jgi:hypothetical protein
MSYSTFFMISLERMRQLEPRLEKMSDTELTKLRDMLYSLGTMAVDSFMTDKSGSKNPVRVSRRPDGDMQQLW